MADIRVTPLRESRRFLRQYVALRNRHADALLTKEVTEEETERWLEEADDIVLVASEGDELLGAVILCLRREGEVSIFARSPGRGIGGILLEALDGEAASRGVENLWAWTMEENTPARKAFEKSGYRAEGVSERVYRGKSRRGVRYTREVPGTAREGLAAKGGGHSAPGDAFGMRPEAKAFPLMSVISFVYTCNARCPNCPYTNSKIREAYRDTPFMSGETFRLIADQCGPHQAWIRISGGGEPMLHRQAVELVEYAKGKGARVGLITNGSRFDEESTRRLLEAGVDMIEFSVDAADADTYARVRPGLTWDVLVRNIRRMAEMRSSLSSPTRIIASGINQQGVDVDKVAAFWEPVVDEFQKRKYLTWGINDPALSADPEPYLPPEERIPCPFLFERLNIDSRGKVMVCGFDIEAKTDMGNIHEESIESIWHGEGFARYRRLHLERRGDELELCRDCPDWKYRSWTHNYWKLVRRAGEKREERGDTLNFMDQEGAVAEDD